MQRKLQIKARITTVRKVTSPKSFIHLDSHIFVLQARANTHTHTHTRTHTWRVGGGVWWAATGQTKCAILTRLMSRLASSHELFLDSLGSARRRSLVDQHWTSLSVPFLTGRRQEGLLPTVDDVRCVEDNCHCLAPRTSKYSRAIESGLAAPAPQAGGQQV